jgi:hypothetical protein
MQARGATSTTVAIALVAALLPVPAASAQRACRASVTRGVLPARARAGLSEPRPRLPHAISHRGLMAALLFGDPLRSPAAPQRVNKILWVARRTQRHSSDLRISAQRMRGTRTVGRHVIRVVRGGPGPSFVNMPAPGCWRMTLAWSGHRDELDLRYR